jgi:hypothetical protein
METLTIQATSHTPEVTFNSNGLLKLEGRSYPEDAANFYNPLIEYVKELTVKSITMDIYLEYINTASSKKLLHMMQVLDDMEDITAIHVNWHYEEGDEDSLETAEIYEESLDRVKFTYSEYADVEA